MSLTPPYFNLFDYFIGDERLASIGLNTALEFRGSRLSYNELRAETDRWTEQLLTNGISEGDRVALLLYDSPAFIAAFLATVSLGAICVPLNTFLSPEEMTFIVRDAGARIVIADENLEEKVSARDQSDGSGCKLLVVDTASSSKPREHVASRPPIPSTTPESPAFLLYTSGSTGAPKGVLHRHASIPHTVNTYAKTILQLASSDRVFSASRLFFAYGLGNSFTFPLSVGASVILDRDRPSAQNIARIFEEQRPTVFFGVPAVYRSLLDSAAAGTNVDTSSLRLCISAGEALPAPIFEEWHSKHRLRILDGIGSTEMLHIFISNRAVDARPGSSGVLVPGYRARLVNDEGDETATGEAGNLWVNGSSAFSGYWNRPELTNETIRDGWVRTGDVYACDAEDFFYHIGRSDDCFKVKGLWVSPVEVESALLAHECVSEAAVVAATDSNGLATARAYIVIRPTEELDKLRDELRAWLSGRLAAHKVPSQIEFIDKMPRTSTGKVQRYKLRRLAKEA